MKILRHSVQATETICTRCGLCCDGSLFADVELTNASEVSSLEVMGLEIEDPDGNDGALLLQPCAALHAKRCRIYRYRPDCCRTFECRLLQNVQRRKVGVESAQAKIAEAFKLIEHLKALADRLGMTGEDLPLKEQCLEALALSEESIGDHETNQTRAELRAGLVTFERFVQETFL